MSTCTAGSSASDSARQETVVMPAVQGAPIMCTLSGGDMPQRGRELAAAFEHLVGAERFADGYRWSFHKEPGFAAALLALARREHECCPFVTFTISTTDEHVVWETRGSESANLVIELFYHLPETLQGDLEAILKQAEKAGLALAGEPISR